MQTISQETYGHGLMFVQITWKQRQTQQKKGKIGEQKTFIIFLQIWTLYISREVVFVGVFV